MKNRETSISTFSFINSVGWLLIVLRLSGCINLNWGAIANYFFVLAITIIAFVLLNTLISCLIVIFKGGDNSVK